MFGSQIGSCKILALPKNHYTVKSILVIPAKCASFIRIQFTISVPANLLLHTLMWRGSFTNWQHQEQAVQIQNINLWQSQASWAWFQWCRLLWWLKGYHFLDYGNFPALQFLKGCNVQISRQEALLPSCVTAEVEIQTAPLVCPCL
jgi:hypothetical protein